MSDPWTEAIRSDRVEVLFSLLEPSFPHANNEPGEVFGLSRKRFPALIYIGALVTIMTRSATAMAEDTEGVLSSGSDVVGHLVAGRFDQAVAGFDATMTRAVSKDRLSALWRQQTAEQAT